MTIPKWHPMSDEPVFSACDENPPAVVFWFKLYAAFLAFVYLLVSGVSLIFLLVDPTKLEMDAIAAKVTGAMLLVLGLGLLAACLVPLFSQPKPWLWIYDLILICLGMTSACFWPMTIPLLIFWLKPETKRHFGKV
jgi:MFS family permease